MSVNTELAVKKAMVSNVYLTQKTAYFINENANKLIFIGLAFYYVVGLFWYSYIEGWTTVDTTYFIVVTLTTTGYG